MERGEHGRIGRRDGGEVNGPAGQHPSIDRPPTRGSETMIQLAPTGQQVPEVQGTLEPQVLTRPWELAEAVRSPRRIDKIPIILVANYGM